MSNLTNVFTDIANSIRTKTGGTDTYKPDEMADAIADIPTGAADVTDNLYDQTALIDGMGYNAWPPHDWRQLSSLASYFIPVSSGDIILMRGAKNWGTTANSVFVDSNKAWISDITSRNGSGGIIPPIVITAPSNAAYVCVTVYVGDADHDLYQDFDTIDVRIWSKV